MRPDQLLDEILEVVSKDEDFPKFELKKDDDGSAVLTMPDGREFMIMVVDISE